MKNKLILSLVFVLSAPCILMLQVTVAQDFPFDGDWSAKSRTTNGPCKRQYSFEFKVDEGQVTGTLQGNLGKYELIGAVDRNGEAEIVLNGPDPGNFIGTFASKKAKGIWFTEKCRGKFKFKRKS